MKYAAILLPFILTGCSGLPMLEQTKVVNAKVNMLLESVTVLSESVAANNEVINQVAGSQHVLEGMTADHKDALADALSVSNAAVKKADSTAATMNETIENVEAGVKIGGAGLGLLILRYIGHIVGGPGGAIISGIATAVQSGRRKEEENPDA